ncbi:DUF4234 domain-containing protein [candidate division WOR-3 bacterium]|nr:DUF4234 domain-containing protein [candidate division WOR-3 bacterium]
MKERNPIMVLILGCVTLGIYNLIWFWQTTSELNSKGATVPNPILMIIPIVGIFYLWKYSEGVEKVTSGGMTGIVSFLLFWFVNPVGMFLAQQKFNEIK